MFLLRSPIYFSRMFYVHSIAMSRVCIFFIQILIFWIRWCFFREVWCCSWGPIVSFHWTFMSLAVMHRVHAARGEASAAQRQQVFTCRGSSSPPMRPRTNTRSFMRGRWRPPSGLASPPIAKLGIGNDFNLLCANAGLHHFVYQGCATYERLTLEFLSTLSHNVGLLPRVDEEERITFRLMDQDFNITLDEWCNYFGFTNNNDDVRYVYDFLEPHPRQSFYQMSYHGHKQRASCIESPAIRYFYYVITNSLQARGEVSKVNDENMLILRKAANLDVGYSPNLGAILLLHLAHQANHTQGDIVCGGVITMLANSLGLNFNHLAPLSVTTLLILEFFLVLQW